MWFEKEGTLEGGGHQMVMVFRMEMVGEGPDLVVVLYSTIPQREIDLVVVLVPLGSCWLDQTMCAGAELRAVVLGNLASSCHLFTEEWDQIPGL